MWPRRFTREDSLTLLTLFASRPLHWGCGVSAAERRVETEAEAVAFLVCQAIALENGTAASDYIRLYDGETETLAASLDRIQKTATEILAALHHSPNEQAQAA